MNTLLVFAIFVVGACVADVSHIVERRPPVAILRSSQDATPDGGYQWQYETEDGISAQAEGSPTGESHGSYRYTAPDGQVIQVDWKAGSEGFNARGTGIPTVPDYIVRSLEYNAAHPYKEPAQV